MAQVTSLTEITPDIKTLMIERFIAAVEVDELAITRNPNFSIHELRIPERMAYQFRA